MIKSIVTVALAFSLIGAGSAAALGHGGGRGFHGARGFRAAHRFHWRGAWAAQPGFYAHRWGEGERLPRGWYAERYRIAEYGAYELTAPPEGDVWVRVGSDAVLVGEADGAVVQTVTDVFY